ncbi:hypothetical protein B296_00029934, partial [Ensete ventricosum]
CGWVGIEKEATQREGGFPSVGGFLVYDGESGAAGGSERAMGGGAAETTGGSGGGGGGFKARLVHYLYSGDKKHVFAGIAVISAVFAVPWMPRDLTPVHLPSSVLFFTAGSRHQSHQDYMEKANQARSERLSSGQPTIK